LGANGGFGFQFSAFSFQQALGRRLLPVVVGGDGFR
jgi:hypothetical protein